MAGEITNSDRAAEKIQALLAGAKGTEAACQILMAAARQTRA